MTHHHDHSHDHHSHDHINDSGHDHAHVHSHAHEIQSEMSFEEKMVRLLEHWIQHNDDHAGTYRSWAEKAREQHMEDVAAVMIKAAGMTLDINKKFEEALTTLTPAQPS